MTQRKLKIWKDPAEKILVIENSQAEAAARLRKNGFAVSFGKFQNDWKRSTEPKYSDIAWLPGVWVLNTAGWAKL